MPAIFLLGLLFCLTNFALKIILKYTHLKGAVISDEFPTELSVYLAMTVAGNSDTKLDYFVLEYDSCLCLHLVFVLLLLFHNRCCTLHIYKKIFRKWFQVGQEENHSMFQPIWQKFEKDEMSFYWIIQKNVTSTSHFTPKQKMWPKTVSSLHIYTLTCTQVSTKLTLSPRRLIRIDGFVLSALVLP